MPCGFCHRIGHNRTTCTAFRAVRERDTQQRNIFGELLRNGMTEMEETLLRNAPGEERNENINTIDLTIPEVLPQTTPEVFPQTPPDSPPSYRLPQTPPPANYSTPNAPRMGRRGRRGGEWNIGPNIRALLYQEISRPNHEMNIEPMMEHLFNDDDEIYTPKKKQLVTCVECPCETTSCAICMEDLTQVDLMVTRCGHQFHSGCMIAHLRKKDECPLCRGILVA